MEDPRLLERGVELVYFLLALAEGVEEEAGLLHPLQVEVGEGVVEPHLPHLLQDLWYSTKMKISEYSSELHAQRSKIWNTGSTGWCFGKVRNLIMGTHFKAYCHDAQNWITQSTKHDLQEALH